MKITSEIILCQRIAATLDAIKSSGGSKFAYHFNGIGDDSRCNLQVVADSSVLSADDITKLNAEAVFNAIKVRPLRFRTVTEALDICAAARQYGWALIIGSEELAPETADTFVADFAVAVGAGQINGGGFLNGDFNAKYNRLLEIKNTDETLPYVGKKFRC